MSLLGVSIAALAACCWGLVYATGQQLLRKDFSSSELLVSCCFVGSVLLFPTFIAKHQDVLQAQHSPQTFAVFVVLLLAAKYLVFWSIQIMGGTDASLVQVSYPVWTAMDLYLTLGERPSRLTAVGATLIFCGIGYITWYREQDKEEQPLVENGNGEAPLQREVSSKVRYSTV